MCHRFLMTDLSCTAAIFIDFIKGFSKFKRFSWSAIKLQNRLFAMSALRPLLACLFFAPQAAQSLTTDHGHLCLCLHSVAPPDKLRRIFWIQIEFKLQSRSRFEYSLSQTWSFVQPHFRQLFWIQITVENSLFKTWSLVQSTFRLLYIENLLVSRSWF